MRTLVTANHTREAAVEARVPAVASATCCNRSESDVVGRGAPFTEEQVEFLGSLVERSVSRALESLTTDPAGANRRGEYDLLPVRC